jgi:peroxiredoxin (alkyl hydroperoxide reductase subunit C)
MKNGLVLLLMLLICNSNLWSQDRPNEKIPLIGADAPVFTAETTEGTLDFPKDFGNNWKIIFSHPRDFTPVCSSEVLELAQMQNEFKEIGVKLVVLSTDKLQSHQMWKAALEEISYKNRKAVKINFPFVDDHTASISKQYGMLHQPTSTTKDVRGVFIINPKDKIEAIFFYPMNIGRNMDEIKRTVIALQAVGKGKDQLLAPANWQAGDDMMVPQFPYTEKQLTENPNIKDGFYSVASFMWFKKMNQSLTDQ